MSRLFETTDINGMKLRNRFVRSATWEGMAAEDGRCTPKLMELMTELAQGGVALIITSHAYVRGDGQAGPWQLGIYEDALIPDLQEMNRRVHDNGCKIVLQLAHAGYFANAKLTGQTPIALSQVEGFAKTPRKELDISEIHDLVKAFGQAGRRAKEAGFDGVQIHAAHGYLLSQSLSPVFNKRNDQYGGSVENRAKFLLEVLQELRSILGDRFPILVKMNSRDFVEGGVELEDALKTGGFLKETGIDCIELSGGTFVSGKLNPSRTGIKSEDKEAYFKDAAKAFKEKLQIPLMLVGGIRSFQLAENLVTGGFADYISLCRPLIREPNLIQRWQKGDLRKATCVSDNQCFGPAMAGEGIYCVVDKKNKGQE
jgi:2,4-dienoyl-CoA reductase-like NADH-dependent reductase (Old Yellow Enzyme family)